MLLAFGTHHYTSSTVSHPPPVQGLVFGHTIGEVLQRHVGMPPKHPIGRFIIDPVDAVHVTNGCNWMHMVCSCLLRILSLNIALFNSPHESRV